MFLKRLLTGLFGGRLWGASTPAHPSIRPSDETASTRPAVRLKKTDRDTRFDHSVLTVGSLRFVGQGVRSPNKRWVVGCSDRLPGMNPRLNERDGSAVLVDYLEDSVLAKLTGLYRPMDAAVADDGTFMVNDANFGNQLSGEVQAFNVKGRKLFARKYKANVYNLGISKCGRYAVVQTANSDNQDGHLLELFDVQQGSPMFSRTPATGWADQYSFVVDDHGGLKHLTVVHKDIGRFSYSPEGEFLEARSYQKARLEKGAPEMRIHAAKEALKADPKNQELARELVDALDIALGDLASERTDYRATGLRVKGEALELMGRSSDALAAYEAAVKLNPRIGVAKRLAALKKGVP